MEFHREAKRQIHYDMRQHAHQRGISARRWESRAWSDSIWVELPEQADSVTPEDWAHYSLLICHIGPKGRAVLADLAKGLSTYRVAPKYGYRCHREGGKKVTVPRAKIEIERIRCILDRG